MASVQGSLPSEFGEIGNRNGLKYDVYINHNQFTDELPSQLGLFTALSGYFALMSNQFCGDLPKQVIDLGASAGDDDAFSYVTTDDYSYSYSDAPSDDNGADDDGVGVAANWNFAGNNIGTECEPVTLPLSQSVPHSLTHSLTHLVIIRCSCGAQRLNKQQTHTRSD